MNNKPIIGITLDLASDNKQYSYAARPWYALRADYANCVTKAGAIPILIPYHSNVNQLLDSIDGLIIPGGDEDIHPKFYNQAVTSNKVKTNDLRAEFELNLTKEAIDRNMPVFGICNGLQIINVLLGGSLIQHIPNDVDSDIVHEQPHPKDRPTHIVNIKDKTFLSSLSDQNAIMVNSTHHQAIDQLGKGLIASAKAPDGIIEAVESANHRFVVGVQWHSEYLNTKLDLNLFHQLVVESSKNLIK